MYPSLHWRQTNIKLPVSQLYNLTRQCLDMIWYDQSSSVSAVCLEYLLIKLLHLGEPPDIFLIVIIESIPKLTAKQHSSHSQ